MRPILFYKNPNFDYEVISNTPKKLLDEMQLEYGHNTFGWNTMELFNIVWEGPEAGTKDYFLADNELIFDCKWEPFCDITGVYYSTKKVELRKGMILSKPEKTDKTHVKIKK